MSTDEKVEKLQNLFVGRENAKRALASFSKARPESGHSRDVVSYWTKHWTDVLGHVEREIEGLLNPDLEQIDNRAGRFAAMAAKVASSGHLSIAGLRFSARLLGSECIDSIEVGHNDGPRLYIVFQDGNIFFTDGQGLEVGTPCDFLIGDTEFEQKVY